MTQKWKMSSDIRFMEIALSIARRGHGNVWPNPSVGCIIVKDDVIIGRGWTQPGGRPHAEVEALRQAGKLARKATAYITLEPCAHEGETASCAKALINAGIERVVSAKRDPDPRVNGRGIELLRMAGLEVIEGIREEEATEVAEGFFSRILKGRPLVTIKVATSLDGKIATPTGESRWITGELARAYSHALRARYDAILIGGRTAVIDDPMLTCRLPGLEKRSPVRVILDGKLELPETNQLLVTASQIPTWIMVPSNVDSLRSKKYTKLGAKVITVADSTINNRDLSKMLVTLGGLGITRLMVEGGGRIIANFFKCGLVDKIVWFRASKVIGNDGVPVCGPLGMDCLGQAPEFTKVSSKNLGKDSVETYVRIE